MKHPILIIIRIYAYLHVRRAHGISRPEDRRVILVDTDAPRPRIYSVRVYVQAGRYSSVLYTVRRRRTRAGTGASVRARAFYRPRRVQSEFDTCLTSLEKVL